MQRLICFCVFQLLCAYDVQAHSEVLLFKIEIGSRACLFGCFISRSSSSPRRSGALHRRQAIPSGARFVPFAFFDSLKSSLLEYAHVFCRVLKVRVRVYFKDLFSTVFGDGWNQISLSALGFE